MGMQLRYIGQSAMDIYFRDFKGNTGFFTLDDFIFRAGTTVAEFYQKLYQQKYQELRQDRLSKDELVGVESDLLSVQTLTVKDNEAVIEFPVMSFLYDKSNVGYQFLLANEPKGVKLERSTMDEVWEYDYLPKTHRVFWRPQNGKLKFFNNASCNVKEVELYYIPSIINNEGKVFGEAMIADGVANIAIAQTVATIKGLTQDTVVKEGLDGNENKIIQSEINKEAIK